MQTRGTATTPHRLYSDPDEGPCARVSEPSLGGDQGPYKEATCTVRPGWPNKHGSYKSRTHTVEELSGSLHVYYVQGNRYILNQDSSLLILARPKTQNLGLLTSKICKRQELCFAAGKGDK